MPPSPSMSSSPRRELKAENHKRGRSLESGFLFREKDDNLALFNEVQSKERDNFLLQSNDDFEDVFATRLQYFSDHKVGLSIPARGESTNLLNEDVDKNDYDWLLTPPDTPLFPCLDDEAPPVNLAPRGRPRSQPISISRSSTMEKSYRSSRGSASPNRLSPSPHSAQGSQSRGRLSSATHSSPSPKLQSSTPSRRPSPPPGRPSTSVPRSSTPTSRRMSTGSSGTVAASRVRGTSPVKTRRGNSASPKIKAWQSNIPGFSLEAPPNLRTSLADRPASYVRGTSPASRNGSRSGRQSMSPTPSRSVSSLQSHERDHFSPRSKGSIASSGDDDVASLQSVPVISSSAARSIGTFQNNRALGFSKKPNRIVSSSSAQKRSFDLALRQMDHRKAPQNMFRPLLSSVPTSTFYGGKVATTHRSMVSRNSSVTTSSTASTDLGTSGAPDTEESEQNHEEVTSMYILAPISDVRDEVFVYDKDDTLNEDVTNKMHDASSGSQYGECHLRLAVDPQSVDSESCSRHDISAASDLVGKDDSANVDNYDDAVLCSRCGCSFLSIDLTGGDLKLCPDCKSLEESSARTTPLTTMVVGYNPADVSSKLLEPKSLDALRPSAASSELLIVSMSKTVVDHREVNTEGQHPNSEFVGVFLENSLAEPLVTEVGKSLLSHLEICKSYINHETSGVEISSQKTQPVSDFANSKVEVPEDAGISLLLKKLSSGKGHIVQGRNFLSSDTDDLSCIRDSTNSLRSSTGHGSLSTSSSTDFSSVRHIENRFQRQPSGKKSEMENYRYDMHSKHQHSLSSFSGTSSHAFQTSSLTLSSHGESSEVSVVYVEKDAEEAGGEQEQSLTSESKEGNITCVTENEGGCRIASEYSSNVMSIHLDDPLVAPVSNYEESASYEKGENFTDGSSNSMDIEVSYARPEACITKEDPLSNAHADRIDVEVPDESLLDTMSEKGIENGHLSSPSSEPGVVSQNSRNSKDEMQEPSGSLGSINEMGDSVDEPASSDCAHARSENHAHATLEETTVVLPDEGGMNARSWTLEEATDTILFCSSIVHNLAYEAANIAIEKETSVPLEGAWPSITAVGNTNTDRKDPRAKTASKHTKKSQKVRKKVEKERKSLQNRTEAGENIKVSPSSIVGAPNQADSLAPPKLESKCNCTIM